MGQVLDIDNSFRQAIIAGLLKCGVKFSDHKLYSGENYGLIIKPLYLEYNFREPIRIFFKGYPFHVGIIRNDSVYSFCPDLKEPHRGTLYKDILVQSLDEWEDGEIFWFVDNGRNYLQIAARLIDFLKVTLGPFCSEDHSCSLSKSKNDHLEQKGLFNLTLEEFNRRHGTSLKVYYNLLSNNCTDVALSILIGQTRCFQIESIVDKIKFLGNIQELVELLPEYGKMWLRDFKYAT